MKAGNVHGAGSPRGSGRRRGFFAAGCQEARSGSQPLCTYGGVRGLLEDIVYGELDLDPLLTAPWIDVQQIIEEMFELGSVGPFLPIDKIRAYTNTFVVAPDRIIRLSTYDARTTRALLGQQEIVGAGPGAFVVPINGNVWTGYQQLVRPPGQ